MNMFLSYTCSQTLYVSVVPVYVIISQSRVNSTALFSHSVYRLFNLAFIPLI